MDILTQDMKYRYSLMKYVEKNGVSNASRKYNKGRSYIYFWLKRFDGTIESLVCQSRRPHSHPSQHYRAGIAPDTQYASPQSGFRRGGAVGAHA